ncbi:hypothetical protein BY458DRAFT_513906 [Sporodiniella umbellata]|nr:hypothetical protein BY458DRAFT_513906 [Sporodiniella umbellata]
MYRIDTFSHVGGFLSGIILAFLLIPVKESSLNLKQTIGIYSIKLCSVLVYGLLLGFLLHRFNTL